MQQAKTVKCYTAEIHLLPFCFNFFFFEYLKTKNINKFKFTHMCKQIKGSLNWDNSNTTAPYTLYINNDKQIEIMDANQTIVWQADAYSRHSAYRLSFVCFVWIL